MAKNKLEDLTDIVMNYIDNNDIDEEGDDDNIEGLFDVMEKCILEAYPEDKYDYEIFRYYDYSDIPDAFNTVMTYLHGKTVVDSHVNTLNESFLITVVTKK